MTRQSAWGRPSASGLEQKLVVPMILLAFVFFAVTIWSNARGGVLGFDFKGSLWQGGRDVLAGRSPYPPADPGVIRALGNTFVYPPAILLAAVPLALLPLAAATALVSLANVAAIALALRIVGVRDWRCYALCLFSIPVASNIVLGQLGCLLALGIAAAWRYRDRAVLLGIAVGALVVAKLFLWPLFVWLLVTRRTHAAAVAALGGLAAVILAWAAIGFDGFRSYPALLTALSDGVQDRGSSLVALGLRLGLESEPSRILAFAVGAGLLALTAWLARREDGDRRALAAAIAAGILISPVAWLHYYVTLYVPLAIAHRRADAAWLVLLLFWLSPTENPPTLARLLVALAAGAALLVVTLRPVRAERVPEARVDPKNLAVGVQ